MLSKICMSLVFVCLLSYVPSADAEVVLNRDSEIGVFKFETDSNGDRQLVRQYKRKLGQVVLAKKNWLLLQYFAKKIEYMTGRDIEITDVVLLDDNLESIHLKEYVSELPMVLNIADKVVCAFDHKTSRFSTCFD